MNNRDIIFSIIKFTDYTDMLNIKLVCKKWNSVAKTDRYYYAILENMSKPIIKYLKIKPEHYFVLHPAFEFLTWPERFQLKLQKSDESDRFCVRYIEGYVIEGYFIDKIPQGIVLYYQVGVGLIFEKMHGEREIEWTKTYDHSPNYEYFTDERSDGYGAQKGVNWEYTGYFKDNHILGYGKLIINNYLEIKGNFLNYNECYGTCSTKKTLRSGRIVDFKLEGYGYLYFSKITKKGRFEDDKLNDNTAKIFIDSYIYYSGRVVNDMIVGPGKFYIHDGFNSVVKFRGNEPDCMLFSFKNFAIKVIDKVACIFTLSN